jgi:hypothetical protein
MNYTEYLELHTNCIAAMRAYFVEAETTSRMLAKCTARPLSFTERLGLISQETIESDAYSTYLSTKRLLHGVALHGYGLPK